MTDTETVLVTGAGGFIGGRVVETFAMDDDVTVKAGVHSFTNAPRIARFPVDIVALDVLDESSLQAAMVDCDYVVHCVLGGYDTTVDGTERVLRTALETDVERVVYLSSAEVYGDEDRVYDETSPLRYTGNEYVRSKIDAEKRCVKFMNRGLSVTVLRPTIVYGPFGEYFTIRISKKLQSGLWGDISALNGYCHPVYVDDVVSAIERGLHEPNAHNEWYTIAGSERLTWNEFFMLYNEEAGLRPLDQRSFTVVLLWALGVEPVRRLGQLAMRDHEDEVVSATATSPWLKQGALFARDLIEKSPAPSELSLYRRKASYPIRKAKAELGYEPQVSLEDGIERSVEWLDHHGYLPRSNERPREAVIGRLAAQRSERTS